MLAQKPMVLAAGLPVAGLELPGTEVVADTVGPVQFGTKSAADTAGLEQPGTVKMSDTAVPGQFGTKSAADTEAVRFDNFAAAVMEY